MSFIEGVGDEVVVFGVIILVFILAATITFFLNSSPFTEHRPVSSSLHQTDSSNQNQNQQQTDGDTQDDINIEAVDSNHTPSNVSNDDETDHITSESEVIRTNDEVCSENTNSQLYPDVNEGVAPSAPDIETQESARESEERHSADPNEIHIRLKYLDDTERTVISNPSVKIGDFKRTHFVEDIANNKVVRLIFSGQLLRDNETLQYYAIANNCVIHVQILQAQTQQSPTSVSPNPDLDLSHLLWPLLSVILGICWILYFKYPEFFNLMSLGMLFVFTGSLIYCYSQAQHQ